MLHSTRGMTVEDPSRCPRCGTLRTTRATSLDLCPACLLTTALSMDDEPCPYQVMAPMSEDSDGVTYLAQALTGWRGYVALKVYGLRDDTQAVLSRYRLWKPALARVLHPSAGKLLDVGLTAEGLLYVASEYVAGWPLTALGTRVSVGIGDRATMARQLIGAIAAAHAAGVVHMKLDTSKVSVSGRASSSTAQKRGRRRIWSRSSVLSAIWESSCPTVSTRQLKPSGTVSHRLRPPELSGCLARCSRHPGRRRAARSAWRTSFRARGDHPETRSTQDLPSRNASSRLLHHQVSGHSMKRRRTCGTCVGGFCSR